jgi:hypothetical protein
LVDLHHVIVGIEVVVYTIEDEGEEGQFTESLAVLIDVEGI